MSRPASAALAQYRRVLTQWPKDPLRPNTQLQDVLSKQLDRRAAQTEGDSATDILHSEAATNLLTDRYKKQFPLRGDILQPKSQPTYFQDLLKELDEVPNRSWLTRVWQRVSGSIRLQ